MYVIKFNGNDKFFYFTKDANHTIGHICDEYIKSLGLNPNIFINDIEFQTYRSNDVNNVITYYPAHQPKIWQRSNLDQNYKLNMLGTNYDWYNYMYSTMNSSTKNIGFGELKYNKPPHISYTKITFFYPQDKFLIHEGFFSILRGNTYTKIFRLDSIPLNYFDNQLKVIELYFRRDESFPFGNRTYTFRISDEKDTFSYTLFANISKGPHETVRINPDKYGHF
jgi:hypothetical protein